METLLEGAKTEEDEGLEARLQAHFTIDRSSYFFSQFLAIIRILSNKVIA